MLGVLLTVTFGGLVCLWNFALYLVWLWLTCYWFSYCWIYFVATCFYYRVVCLICLFESCLVTDEFAVLFVLVCLLDGVLV